MLNRRYLFILFFFLHVESSFAAIDSDFTDEEITSSFAFESIYYISPPLDEKQSQYYYNLWFNIDEKTQWKSFSFEGSFLARFPITNENYYFHLNVPELYASYKYNFSRKNRFHLEMFNFSIGRKIQNWSYMDNYWGFDLWNSYNNWDPIYPKYNGLIGSFVNLTGNNVSLDFFIGGIYLPNSGIKIEHDSKKIYSVNRWFAHVPVQVRTAESAFDIKYWLKKPFIYDVLFQESYIFSLEMWTAKKIQLWGKFNFGYKPTNASYLIRNNKNTLRISDKEKIHVSQTIAVFPVKHKIISFESGMNYRNFYTLVSWASNQLITSGDLSDDWVFIKERVSFNVFSVFTGHEWNISNRLTQYLQGGLISTQSKKPHSAVLFKKDSMIQSPLVEYKILNGSGLDWTIKFLSETENLKAKLGLKYWYSFDNKGGLLIANISYYFDRGFYLEGIVNIIGVSEDTYTSFLDKFRANDRLLLRIGNVF